MAWRWRTSRCPYTELLSTHLSERGKVGDVVINVGYAGVLLLGLGVAARL